MYLHHASDLLLKNHQATDMPQAPAEGLNITVWCMA